MSGDGEAYRREIEERAAEIRKAQEDGEHLRTLAEALWQGRGDQTFEQHHGGQVKVVTDPAPRPFEDPHERRAFCLKQAIEAITTGVGSDEAVEFVLKMARKFEAYINGADSETPA